MVNDQDCGLDRRNDLIVTRGFNLLAFLRERSREAPAASDVGDGTTETIALCQGGAVGAFSVPVGSAETVKANSSKV